MKVRLLGCISSPDTITGSGPATSWSSPFSLEMYQRSSPGFAGFGWRGSSHGAQKRFTHSPSGPVGGLPAQTMRWRTFGLSMRIQAFRVRNCVSVKWQISS